MTTTSTKLTTDLGPAELTLRHRVDSVDGRLVPWRLTLNSAWRRKMDEVIALSKAICGLTLDDGGSSASREVRVSSRLEARTERAYDELVAIEDAIARIDDGTYGICASCSRVMPDEWLADEPEVLYCPDCALRRVSSRPGSPTAPPAVPVHRARPKPGPGVRRRDRAGLDLCTVRQQSKSVASRGD